MNEDKEIWPDPTPEMLKSPEFNAVWELIKQWQVHVIGIDADDEHSVPTGRHVRAILDAIRGSRPKTLRDIVKVLQQDVLGGKARMILINKMDEMLTDTVI
jgi:hypothetical protein